MGLRKETSSLLLCGLVLMLLGFPTRGTAGDYRVFFNHNHTIYSLENPGWEAFMPSVADVI